MTKAENADRRAVEKESGKGSISNKDGTATGPGSSAATQSKQDRQHAIGGQGSATAERSRPGHKTNTDASMVPVSAEGSMFRPGCLGLGGSMTG
ncbi:MAG: hypothetical protein ACJ8AI_01585 [Rhodopila sp.]|jgi:hypothetical protein